jgi:gliding motility-associated-like protein
VTWASGGVKTISLAVTENDCDAEVFTQDVFVETPLVAPVIMCDTDNTSITFSWAPVVGATGYQVIDVSGPAGILSGTSYSVTGLDPGDTVSIQLVIETDNICGNLSSEIQTCIAQDCPDIILDVTAIDPLCADDDPAVLAATVTGGDGSGTITWSGTGVTGNIFDPSIVPQPGDYQLSVVYQEGVCTYNDSVMITVNEVPTADFSADSPVCEDSIATINYLGNASNQADYQWDFDGGTANPGTGQGAHEVSWATAGIKTISLTVVENNCTSSTATQMVEVETPLEPPVISCETTSSSILFSWQPVAGAVEYQLVIISGSTGTLNGTTYFVDELSPGDEVEIEVIAIGNGPCGNSSNTALCTAQDCMPLSASLSGPQAVCAGDNAMITLDISSDATGPFTLTYEVNDNPVTAEFTAGTSTIDLVVSENTIIEIISIIDNSNPECIYNGASTLEIMVEEASSAGSPAIMPQLCEGTDSLISLTDLLIGADAGGVWEETSSVPSTGNAFDAANGTFNPLSQGAGTYSFTYTTGAGGLCPESTATLEVEIAGLPVADAGEDMELTCNMGMVTLGSNNSSGNSFFWSAPDSVVISNPTDPFIEVGQPGTYTLTTTNAQGCSSTDEVVVSANLEVPVFEASITEISCFEANDGAIILSNITGGQPPYQASVNGGAFSSQTAFFNLGGDMYDIMVQDANGCISQIEFNLEEPEQVLVTLSTNLEGENVIPLGDSVLLSAIYSPTLNIDTIYWEPDSIGFNSNNASSVWVSPQITSSFSVTIANENGCSDSDNTVVIVEKNRPVYIPNIFSPNEDGRNDIFYIQAGNSVVRIKEFSIFNRWGEPVFITKDVPANTPTHGWDGTFRGERMNSGVFVYYAEIAFSDGEVILFKGDVTLVR